MTTNRFKWPSFTVSLLSACLLMLTGTATAHAAPGDVVNVPDANFKKCINETLAHGPTADITQADFAALTELNCSNKSISDATGLVHASNLTKLDLGWNFLTSIDLSGATQLTHLKLTGNQLPSVDLAALTQLSSLNLSGNELTSVDLATQSQLTELDLTWNKISSVDLAGLTQLTNLKLTGNRLRSVDLAAQTRLTNLEIGSNRLRSIDLAAQTQLTNLGLPDNQLTSIDVSAQTQLTNLWLSQNHLTSIDLSGLTQLIDLGLGSNQLTSINLAGLPQLTMLTLYDNHLVDFSSVPSPMEHLDISGQSVKLADASANAAFAVPRVIAADGSQITTVTMPAGCSYHPGASAASNTVTCRQPGNYEFNFSVFVSNAWHDVTFAVKVTGQGQYFTDVPPGAPFYTEINWMGTAGISAGYPDGTYRPTANVSRAAMAAFLYRAAGKPAFNPTTASPFSDAPVGAPFYKEITWMRTAGISAGYGDGTYRPTANVSRAAMAAFLYRAAGKPAFNPPAVSPFSDVPPGAPFYKEITWMAHEGISAGYGDGTYRPYISVSRAAMAAFLYRAYH